MANWIDHIVLAAPSLDAGCRAVEALTGATPVFGGVHTGAGTHNSLLSLGPDSMLDISHFSFESKDTPDGLEATLHRGTLSAVSGRIVAKTPEAMRIKTPTTVLGVRGTEFFVKVTNPEPVK